MRILRSMALLVLLIAAVGVAQQPAPGNGAIRKERLRADLYFLASDNMRGRLTGTPENRLAAEWIRSRFERAGLTPAGAAGSFLQPFDLGTATIGEGNQIVVSSGATPGVAHGGEDFFPLRFSASGSAAGPVTFAGFGISAPALGREDLPPDLVRGRIVLMLEHEPGERDPHSVFDGLITSEHAVAIRKTLAAQERGALGVLFVADVHNHPEAPEFRSTAASYWPAEPPRLERYSLGAWIDRIRIPAAQISPALAQALVGDGAALAALAGSAEHGASFTPVALRSTTVDMTTSVDRRAVADRNVLAALEGSDPSLRDEWVVVGAHYDHDGADGARVYNGADDNGSGLVGLLAIADAFAEAAQAGHRPRRSVLFAAWNSEERGLLGAWAFTEAPTVPLDRIAAALNLDMIGRNEEVPPDGGVRFIGLDPQTAESNANAVNVVATSRSADLKAMVERANANIGLTLRLRYDNNSSNLMRRSDHWPFLQHGVPAVWFHTGLHPDYHTIHDRPEKVNYDKLEKIARLAHQVAWDLAVLTERPRLVGFGGGSQ